MIEKKELTTTIVWVLGLFAIMLLVSWFLQGCAPFHGVDARKWYEQLDRQAP